MGFYNTKPAFRQALRPMARRLSMWHPDVWTWVAVGVACLASWLLLISRSHFVVLLVVPWLLFLRLLLNVLDGVIAEETHLSSARGEALSEFTDRLSDVAILGGVALSGFGHASLAVIAIVVVLLVSYVGILGKAVGAGRQYGGLMGKPDRMVVIMLGCVAQYVVLHMGYELPVVLGRRILAFDVASLAIVLLGLYTIMFRLRAIFHAFDQARRLDG